MRVPSTGSKFKVQNSKFKPAEVPSAIAQVRRLMGFGRVATWIARGVLAGGLCAAALVGFDHLISIGPAVMVGSVAVILGGLAGAVAGIRHWPRELDAARAVDRRFELRDRTTTALELWDSALPVSILQRSDAGMHLHGLRLRSSARGQWRGYEAAGAAVMLVLFVVLAFTVPTAVRGASSPSSTTDRQRIHKALHSEKRVAHNATAGLTTQQAHNAAIRKLAFELRQLRRQLRTAANKRAALRAISNTQQALHRIAAGLHPISRTATSQLSHSLRAQMNASERAGARGSVSRQLRAAAQALHRLASTLAHMSPSQKAALAQALERAANANSNSSIRSSLRQAASSLQNGNPRSAASALQQAASAMARTASQQTAQARVASASSQLEALKGEVSGLSGQQSTGTPYPGKQGSGKGAGKGGKNGTGTGQGGHGQGQGQGKGHGQGQGQGQGRGQGNGSGHGRGSGSGQGHGSGSGRGGAGGHGIGGGRGGAGNHGAGKSGAQVYVPGKNGSGTKTVLNGGPNGAPLPGSTIPYQQVLARYQQSARAALDHGSLPPSLRQYVRDYFTSISR
jgi:ribosomal protein S20